MLIGIRDLNLPLKTGNHRDTRVGLSHRIIVGIIHLVDVL